MVRNYKRKTDRGAGGAWLQEDMNKAVDAVRNGLMSYRQAALAYEVPKTTLELKARGWKGRPSTENSKTLGKSTTLSNTEEEKLSKFLKIMSTWGFGLSKQELLNVVQEYIQKNEITNSFQNDRPGNDWFKSFCERYDLRLKKPEIVEGSRARQSSDPFVIFDFFDKLSSIVKELKLESKPECIYNCDETGFKNDPTTTKVVTAKGIFINLIGH
jgi:hypothetical protein